MDINISCAECGDSLEIVREGTYWGSYSIEIKPCEYCIQQAIEQSIEKYRSGLKKIVELVDVINEDK